MSNDKFIWQQGDVKIVDESSFLKNAKLYDDSNDKPFMCCHSASVCYECDEEDQHIAIHLAKRVYDCFFATSDNNEELLNKVINSYVNLCKKLLVEDCVLTKQLYCCSKMQLLDMLVKNGNFTPQQIKSYL